MFFAATTAMILWVLVKGQRDFDPTLVTEPSGVNLWSGATPVVVVAWTLFYEVNFYILVGVLILLRKRLDEKAARGGIQVFLVGCLFAPLVNEPVLNVVTLQPFGPLFALGAVTGISVSAGGLRRNLPTILLAGFLSYPVILDRVAPTIGDPIPQTLWTLGLLAVAGVFLLWDKFVKAKPGARPHIASVITTLSLMTYPVYLIHQEFGVRLVNFVIIRGADPGLSYFISGVCLLLVTWAGVKFFEPWARAQLRRLFAWNPA
jgi:peptidoglycan/LPS O-acetylase OafA/YrhL